MVNTNSTSASGSYPATDEMQASENITSDSILWYNVGIYRDCGYAVPNPSNDIGSLNPNMLDFTTGIGRGLFYIMHREDADLSTPPTVDTLYDIHQLVMYMRRLLQSRIQPDNERAFNPQHIAPAGEVFRVWPVPYFNVRNLTLKRWCRYALYLLGELFQNSQNRRLLNTYAQVGQRISGYLQKIYVEMSCEFFGFPIDQAKTETFALTDKDFASYAPQELRPDWEQNDPVPALDNVFSEDRMSRLVAGIPLQELPPLEPYPTNILGLYEQMRAAQAARINPDTGQPASDGSRITTPPAFPTGTSFVG